MNDRRILVVDDDAPCRDALVEFLHREGYRVSIAKDGTEAFQVIRRVRFDCSVMDVHMPGLTGLEVIRRLVAEPTPPQSIPPTVFVSSDRSVEQTVRSLAGPPVGFIPKPIQLDALRRTLQLLLRPGFS